MADFECEGCGKNVWKSGIIQYFPVLCPVCKNNDKGREIMKDFEKYKEAE